MKAKRRDQRDTLGQKAVAAWDEAVAEVGNTHRRAKRKLAIWRDGKAVMISPEEAMAVREERTAYGVTK